MVEQFDEELLHSLHAVAVVHLQRHLQCAACSVLAEVGRCDIMVGNEHLRRSHEINVAVNAREVPHVLSFEIRAVAPAVDAHRKLVVAHLGEVGDVELGVGVRVLRVAYVLAVHPYHGSAVHAVEVNEKTLAVPRFGHAERAAVEADCVVVLHAVVGVAHVGVRRIVLERVAHVGVYRSAVACHLPRERHADVVPCRVVVVGSEELAFARTVLCSGHELELPLAVEQLCLGVLRSEPRLVERSVALHSLYRSVGYERSVSILLVVAHLLLVLNPRSVELALGGGCSATTAGRAAFHVFERDFLVRSPRACVALRAAVEYRRHREDVAHGRSVATQYAVDVQTVRLQLDGGLARDVRDVLAVSLARVEAVDLQVAAALCVEKMDDVDAAPSVCALQVVADREHVLVSFRVVAGAEVEYSLEALLLEVYRRLVLERLAVRRIVGE